VRNFRSRSGFSEHRVYSPFCPCMEFLDVSWHQMHDGNSQFYEANDVEIPL
jgi:hypothetical protein